ncbi:hypothetical protein Droror1_Dr00000758 [Drosera rotundifolia]
MRWLKSRKRDRRGASAAEVAGVVMWTTVVPMRVSPVEISRNILSSFLHHSSISLLFSHHFSVDKPPVALGHRICLRSSLNSSSIAALIEVEELAGSLYVRLGAHVENWFVVYWLEMLRS